MYKHTKFKWKRKNYKSSKLKLGYKLETIKLIQLCQLLKIGKTHKWLHWRRGLTQESMNRTEIEQLNRTDWSKSTIMFANNSNLNTIKKFYFLRVSLDQKLAVHRLLPNLKVEVSDIIIWNLWIFYSSIFILKNLNTLFFIFHYKNIEKSLKSPVHKINYLNS